MKRKLLAGYFVGLFLIILSGTSIAKNNDLNSFLKGKYQITENKYCVIAFGEGFEDDLTLINGGFTYSIVSQGEYFFNGDGTGTKFSNWMAVYNDRVNPGQSPLNIGTSEGDFTYIVNEDKTFDFSAYLTTIIDAKNPGAEATIEVNGTSFGIIENGLNTFTLTDINPSREIITYPDGNVRERICTKFLVGIKSK